MDQTIIRANAFLKEHIHTIAHNTIMKSIFLIATILLSSIYSLSFAQNSSPRPITREDSLHIESTISIELERLEDSLQSLDKFYIDELFIEFKSDTFAIERRREMKMDINWSTAGMNNATYEAEKEYDHLLNKYYQKLMRRLDNEDKLVLRDAQRDWITFRDSEHEIIRMLTKTTYSGGGTIQTTISAGQYLEFTKSRVVDLYRYLARMM